MYFLGYVFIPSMVVLRHYDGTRGSDVTGVTGDLQIDPLTVRTSAVVVADVEAEKRAHLVGELERPLRGVIPRAVRGQLLAGAQDKRLVERSDVDVRPRRPLVFP